MKLAALIKTSSAKTSLLIILLFSLMACEQQKREKPQSEVVVKKVEQFPYQNTSTFVGHLTASSDVAIEARVKAKITAVHFKEGSKVAAGEVLFELNDDELQAEYSQVKAEVSRSVSALSVAQKNHDRGQELAPDGYISKSELDNLEGQLAEASSQLEAAKAKLENARVNLAYSKIAAPLSGTIDRSKFSVGDIVSPESGSLTTIVAVNMMEVPFQLSEKVYWKIVRRYQKENIKMGTRKPIVEIAFSASDIYEHQGSIEFISNRVNPETGSMEVRAIVPNPDGILKPGQYVQVILKSPTPVETIMIPQSAVQSDQQGDFVMIIVDDNKVKRSNVKLGKRVDTSVIVEEGLVIDQILVISGVQQIRVGQQVKTKFAVAPTSDADPSAINH
ncbi:efflux RND transporter periplasmic adaptor subunit [Thalassotalea sp. ND16A]|uniref:efflux RND transporter periplasmic adaptor subunit n=1 Tax=Thalassotalea sp. ND16A TaxID=1535422 RepID=UPI000519ED26|nr:efflux RND transporter periplasmic adaptor subunit [Thalassotalea sp. ND16A]KGK00982.1 hypothetical protein ND16A_3184 [Thalassotalea sp. ND16A]